MVLPSLSVAAASAAVTVAAASAAVNVTVVNWCDNSMRVMVNPVGEELMHLRVDPPGGDPGEPFAALDGDKCTPGAAVTFIADGCVQIRFLPMLSSLRFPPL